MLLLPPRGAPLFPLESLPHPALPPVTNLFEVNAGGCQQLGRLVRQREVPREKSVELEFVLGSGVQGEARGCPGGIEKTKKIVGSDSERFWGKRILGDH